MMARLAVYFYIILLSCGLSGCMTSALLASSVGSSLPMHKQVSDMQIKTEAIHVISTIEALNDTFNIDVAVFNDTVLVVGQVASVSVKQEIGQALQKLEGIRAVYNEITVGKSRNLGEYTYDGWLTAKVKHALWLADLSPTDFKVVTERHVVYLLFKGQASRAEQAAHVASYIYGVRGVVKIPTG